MSTAPSVSEPEPAPPPDGHTARSPEAPATSAAVTEVETAPHAGPDDARFVHHLHFEHLRNLTTLSVSATGGGFLALQAGLFDSGPVTAVPLLCFAVAAVLSLLTQRTLIRDLGLVGTPSKAFGWMSEGASALFGAGVGSTAAILLAERFL